MILTILAQGLTQDLISGLVWSLIGFIAGYLVANLKMEMDQIKEAVVNDDSDDSGQDEDRDGYAGGHGGPGGEHRPRFPRWLGVVVILLAVVTVAQGVYFSRQARETSHCQAQFNSDFSTALTLRNGWAAEDRAQLTKMIDTVLTGATPEVRRKALEDYLAAVHKNDALRAQHPLPELSDRDCT